MAAHSGESSGGQKRAAKLGRLGLLRSWGDSVNGPGGVAVVVSAGELLRRRLLDATVGGSSGIAVGGGGLCGPV